MATNADALQKPITSARSQSLTEPSSRNWDNAAVRMVPTAFPNQSNVGQYLGNRPPVCRQKLKYAQDLRTAETTRPKLPCLKPPPRSNRDRNGQLKFADERVCPNTRVTFVTNIGNAGKHLDTRRKWSGRKKNESADDVERNEKPPKTKRGLCRCRTPTKASQSETAVTAFQCSTTQYQLTSNQSIVRPRRNSMEPPGGSYEDYTNDELQWERSFRTNVDGTPSRHQPSMSRSDRVPYNEARQRGQPNLVP